MTEPIRWGWCDTHNGITMPMSGGEAFCLANQLPANIGNCVNRPAVLVESRDGDGRLLGLLAADECGCHGGDGCDPRNISEGLYPQCDGSSFTIRAAGVPPALSTPGTALPGTWVRANFKPGGKMVRVAVLPVEQP